MPTEVVNDSSLSRYELLLDGVAVGFADYLARDDTIVFVHTEIDPAFRGAGLGGELARGALNLVRAESETRVVLNCAFLSAWVERHPEYRALTDR